VVGREEKECSGKTTLIKGEAQALSMLTIEKNSTTRSGVNGISHKTKRNEIDPKKSLGSPEGKLSQGSLG